MHIKVNGQPLELLDRRVSVTKLLEQLGYEDHFVAVAVNSHCILRKSFACQYLKDHDEIEILAPMAGG